MLEVQNCKVDTRGCNRSEKVWNVLEPAAELTGKDLPVYKANMQRLREVVVFLNAQILAKDYKANKETQKHGPVKGPK